MSKAIAVTIRVNHLRAIADKRYRRSVISAMERALSEGRDIASARILFGCERDRSCCAKEGYLETMDRIDDEGWSKVSIAFARN